MRYLYSFLFYLAIPFILLRLLWRSRHYPEYRQRWKERFGFFPKQLSSCLWIHAVSVGETIAAIPLIEALKKEYPDVPMVVTNMTITGALRVKAIFGKQVIQAYIPYDLPDAAERFLKKMHPKIAIIIETELWPNLFAACKKHEIPVLVTNARLSPKSAKGYQWIRTFMQPLFASIAKIATQSQEDAHRFIELGVDPAKVTVVGNIKFDMVIPADLQAKTNLLRNEIGERLIWIAASTHPTEEEIILATHQEILSKNPSALLILVPRHPERFNEVAQLIKQTGLCWKRRSEQTQCSSDTQIYLADTMGELLLLYSICDVAFVAGSFADIGGHNLLEPALLAKPILCGPSIFNFQAISQLLLNANALSIVKDKFESAREINYLFSNEAERKIRGENAFKVVAANRGAVAKQLKLIKELIYS